MRKLFTPLIMSLFFFLPLRVHAAAHTINVDSSVYSIFEEPGFCEFYHSIVDNNSNYVIAVQNYCVNSSCQLLYRYDTEHFTNVSTFLAQWQGGLDGLVYKAEPLYSSFYWNWFNVPGFTQSNGNNQQYNLYFPFGSGSLNSNFVLIIALSMPIVSNERGPFTLTIGNDSVVFGSQSTIKNAPTLLDMYKISHSDPTICSVTPPTPTDDFPILTSFYSLFLEKVGELTEFFTSSYVYLSVFVIILFYIVLLLFWRFLK